MGEYQRGTQRICDPLETLIRIKPVFRQVGISRLADVTRLDDIGIPTWQAIRPNSRTLSVSQGKGLTDPLAQVSAAMESIELWHAENAHFLPRQRMSVADANTLLSYGPYDLEYHPYSVINDQSELDWSPAQSLLDSSETLVPTEYILLDGSVSYEWEPPTFRKSSNGLASGNTYNEAALHGMLEIFEREALARFHRAKPGTHNRVNPDSVSDSDCHWLIDQIVKAGNELTIIDVTWTDFAIPCFWAVIYNSTLDGVYAGAGCHIDSTIALSRALTEAAQSRLTDISGARDDIDADNYGNNKSLLPQMTISKMGNLISFDDVPTSPLTTVDDEVEKLVDRTHRLLNRPVLVADLSHPDINIPVVKVIIPGLSFEPHGRMSFAQQV